ncbi:hypothetical protein V9K67_19650 [Paraflavisolibacter sp. H34]|uniref:hypothetical protein n=1 Tax=Huijunlia imazamoxiresistens TaxID=3127457 RepID=UPI00301829A0
MIHYHNKRFRSVQNSANGEVGTATEFEYSEAQNIVTATYKGGNILSGHLIALKNPDGSLDMRYHHVNVKGELMTGTCHSVPELLPDGRLRLHESWRWTSGDGSEGQSIIEELRG